MIKKEVENMMKLNMANTPNKSSGDSDERKRQILVSGVGKDEEITKIEAQVSNILKEIYGEHHGLEFGAFGGRATASLRYITFSNIDEKVKFYKKCKTIRHWIPNTTFSTISHLRKGCETNGWVF